MLSNWQNCRVRLCLCYQGSLSLHKNSLSNTFCPQQLQGHSQKVFSSSISGSTEGNSNKIISTFSEFFFQGEASPFFSYLSLILLFSFFETCQPEYTQVTKKCFYPTLEGFNFNFEKSEMCLWPRNPFKSFVLMCVTGYTPSHKCRS